VDKYKLFVQMTKKGCPEILQGKLNCCRRPW